MAEKKLSVVITGDAKGARKAFGDVGSSAGGMQSKLQSVGAGVGKIFKAAAVGAGVLAVGVTAFLKGGVDSLINIEKLGAQTEAVIKSTGGAAGVTRAQVDEYAGALERATGVEAEVITQGQNMLLTFTNIKNGVGAGNDIFNQATDIMTDMSVAMGTDASKTAVQLGKALNDPIKGISALSKVGVSFTEQQKAQIKAMVEAGDVAGAQKVILGELNKEFGGSAKAFGDTTAGKVAKLKNLFGDFQEALASKLLPVVTKVADWLADKIPKASEVIQAKLVELAPTFDKIAGYAEDVVGALGRFAERMRPVVEAVAGFIAKNPAPFFAALAVVIGGALLAATIAWGTAMWAANAPIILVLGSIALLAGGLVYAYQHFEGFRNVVDGVASWLTGTALPALQSFASLVAAAFGELVGWVRDHWGQIKGYIEGAIRTVSTIVGGVISGIKVAWQTWGDELVSIAQTMWGYIKGTVENGIRLVKGVIDGIKLAWATWGDEILTIAKTYWGYIKGTVENALNLVKGVIDVVMGVIRGDWGKAWDGLKGIAGAVWDQIKLAAETGLKLLGTVISAAWDGIKLAASTAWDAFTKIVSDAIDDAVRFVKGLPGRIVAAVGNLNDKLYQAGKDVIAGLVRGIRDSIPSVTDVLGGITDLIPDWKGPAERDRTLLEPAGRLIMGGLVDGIKAGIPALESALDAVSSRIASRQMGAGAGAFTFAGGGTMGASAGATSFDQVMGQGVAQIRHIQGETDATVTRFSTALDRLNYIMGTVSAAMTLAEARAAVLAATAQQAARGADALARWNEALARFFAGGSSGPAPVWTTDPMPVTPSPAPVWTTDPMPRGRSGSATYVTIQMNGPVLDGRELGRLAAEGLNEYGATQNQPIIATSLVGAPR